MKKEEEKKAKVKKETKKTVKETSKPKKENKIVNLLHIYIFISDQISDATLISMVS